MSITDIFEETSKKYMNKSLVGDTIVQGVMVGIVVENNNKQFPGMVRVQIPTRDKDKNILQWMKVISFMGGKTWGMYCIPEIDDEVVIVFENGNINNAYVIGTIFKSDSQMLSDNYTDENYKKVLLTKGKNTIAIDDEADKQKINIQTNKGHTFSLDDEKNLISVKDKDGKNSIEIDTEKGTINVKADSKLVVDINGVKVEMIGDSKKISVNCDTITVKANQQVSVEGQTQLQLR